MEEMKTVPIEKNVFALRDKLRERMGYKPDADAIIPVGTVCITAYEYSELIREGVKFSSKWLEEQRKAKSLEQENAELHAENADLKLKIEHFDKFLKTSGGWFKDKYDEWLAEELKDF